MRVPLLRLGIFLLALFICDVSHAQDVVELLTGVKFEGQVKSIDKEKKLVTFSAMIGGQTIERVYPYGKIHAVTYQGRRHILTEKTAIPTASPETRGTGDKATGASAANGRRTPAEVKSLIEQAGKITSRMVRQCAGGAPADSRFVLATQAARRLGQREERRAVPVGHHQPQSQVVGKAAFD